MTPYYDDGTCTIYHGDCREILPTLYDVAGIVTDPPYGVGFDYGDDFTDIRGEPYWTWFFEVLELMRQTAATTVFTHSVKSLQRIQDWDWLAIWNKPMSSAGLNAFPVMPHWEPIYLYGIKMRPDLPRSFDVFSHNPVNKGTSAHPCPKPEPLIRKLINWTVPTGLIVDPFLGSGTTLNVAKSDGRRAVGIEQSERYCEIAAKRLAQEVLAL